MATDIAFALGVLAILGNRVPVSLKVFVVAFAIMDDLGAVVVIAAFYTTHLSLWHLAAATGLWIILALLNRVFRVMSLVPYLLGGLLLWWLMLQSGVHATIAGVALAFAIPFSAKAEDERLPRTTRTVLTQTCGLHHPADLCAGQYGHRGERRLAGQPD